MFEIKSYVFYLTFRSNYTIKIFLSESDITCVHYIAAPIVNVYGHKNICCYVCYHEMPSPEASFQIQIGYIPWL